MQLKGRKNLCAPLLYAFERQKKYVCPASMHLQGRKNMCAPLLCICKAEKIFVPRFYAFARHKKYVKKYVCLASMQLKKACAPSPFAPAPYKINFAWPLISALML
jgi:hypothetical protein